MRLQLLLPTQRAREAFVLEALQSLAGTAGSQPRVLDVGCGEANLHPRLQPLCRSLVGCDVDARDVARAARGGGDYRVAEAAHLPWADHAFDAVLCLEAIEHIVDVAGALREFARVLRPGGALILTCPSANFPFTYDPLHWLAGRRLLPVGAYAYGHTWLPSEAQIRAALAVAGFTDVCVTGLTGSLAALPEAYWAGLAQRLFKANSGNGGGGPDRPTLARSRGTPSVGLGFVARQVKG